MPTSLYLTAHQPAKWARLTRSSIPSISLTLGLIWWLSTILSIQIDKYKTFTIWNLFFYLFGPLESVFGTSSSNITVNAKQDWNNFNFIYLQMPQKKAPHTSSIQQQFWANLLTVITWQTKLTIHFVLSVVYFDQRLGAAHSKRWMK